MINKIKVLIDLYAKITLGVLFAAAFYISVLWGFNAQISVRILWQIPIVSAVCTVPILMFPTDGERELSKKGMLIRRIIYFVFVNCSVLGLGWLFGWFIIEKPETVALMECMIIVVYVIVNAVCYINDNAAARNMNRKLEEMKKSNSQ